MENTAKTYREVLKKESQGYTNWRLKNEPARLKFEKSRKFITR